MYQIGDIVYRLINNQITEFRIVDILNTGNGTTLTLLPTQNAVRETYVEQTSTSLSFVPMLDYTHCPMSEAYLTIDALLTALVAQFYQSETTYNQTAA